LPPVLPADVDSLTALLHSLIKSHGNVKLAALNQIAPATVTLDEHIARVKKVKAEAEVTEFEGSKAVLLQKGRSTRVEVISLMGLPSGELIYPMVKDITGSALVYVYSYARFAGMFTSYNNFLLTVTLDDKNIVTDVSCKKDEVEQL
jgi:hypothetical protein